MGLLERAESYLSNESRINIRDIETAGGKKGGNNRGLLERAMIILKEEDASGGEAMGEGEEEVAGRGLLNRAEDFLVEIGGEEAGHGLLERAEEYVGEPEILWEAEVKAEIYEEKQGLLEKAEEYKERSMVAEEPELREKPTVFEKTIEYEEKTEFLEPVEPEKELEEIEKKGPGLIERAEKLREEKARKPGLLGRAESLIEEEIKKELFPEKPEEGGAITEPTPVQELIKEEKEFDTLSKTGFLDRAEKIAEELEKGAEVEPEEVIHEEAGVRREEEIPEEAEVEPEEVIHEEVVIEHEEKIPEKIEIEAEKTQEKFPVEKVVIKELPVEDFTYEKISWYQNVLSEKGFEALFEEILRDIKRESGANFCGMYLFEGRMFELEAAIIDESIGVSPFKKNFRMKKNLKDWILEQTQKPIRIKNLLKKLNKNESKQFNGYRDWLILPLISEGTIWGFILLDSLIDESTLKVKKENAHESKLIKLLAVATVFASRFCSVKKLESKADKLDKKNTELSERFEDISKREKAKTLDGILELITAELKIGAFALFLVGEDKKIHLIKECGLTEEVLKNYRISLRDKGIRNIIKSGEPGIPQDEQKRVKRVFKHEEHENKRFIIVPVKFGGDTVGILIINEISLSGRKIPPTLMKRISVFAGGLIPFLIEERLSRREPHYMIEYWMKKQIFRARRFRKKFCLYVFIIDGIKKVETKAGSGRLSRVLDECGKEIRSRFSTPDRVIRFSHAKWVGVVDLSDKAEARIFAGSVQESIKNILTKEKLSDLRLRHKSFWYPDDFKDEKKLMLLLG